jgi:hypothetical protein
MGSNNVIVMDNLGQRAGLAPTIAVGEGPTGIVVDAARAELYVLDKFEAAISVVSTATETEVARVPFFDPSPLAIKHGRRHLYDTHETSGTGVVACGSCHVDARMDHLSWDLGNPAGAMKVVDSSQNLGASVPGLNTGFADWHPMKGPMPTQTLQDIIGKSRTTGAATATGFGGVRSRLHRPARRRRDADSGGDAGSSRTSWRRSRSRPTLYRNFDYPAHRPAAAGALHDRPLRSAGQPLPHGNAVSGLASFRPPTLLTGGALACVSCHTRSTGEGTDYHLQGFQYQPFPVGPNGEHHLAMVSVDGLTNISMKIPGLRTLYVRTGFNLTQLESTSGFGYLHDGSVDSVERFVDEPVFNVTSDQQTANLVAFLLCFGGNPQGFGSTTQILEPPGPASLISHAAVGKPPTLRGPASPAEEARLDQMVTLAGTGAVGLVAKGRAAGLERGWYYLGGNLFQSDRRKHTTTRAALEALAGPGSELTFTVVPKTAERRIGVDRDSDGWFDRDELDAGSDPADPTPPKVL